MQRTVIVIVALGLMLTVGCRKNDAVPTSTPEAKPTTPSMAPANSAEVPPEVKPQTCQEQDACRIHGLCTQKHEGCVAGSEADCKGSLGCRALGACSEISGECRVIECNDTPACHRDGRCVTGRDARSCAWTGNTDLECQSAQGKKRVNPCQTTGQCTTKDGYCVATQNAQCAASALCKTYGKCAVNDGECIAKEDAHCKASIGCLESGRCTAASGQCVAGSDADCANSKRCVKAGYCRAENSECAPAKTTPSVLFCGRRVALSETAVECTDPLLEDIAPLAQLKHLEGLRLSGTQVTDLAPLKNLSKLKTLVIEYTPIPHLSALSGLNGLEQLSLEGTAIQDISPLASLEGLQLLYLSFTGTSNLEPLANMHKLQSLSLGGTDVKNLHGISKLESLRSLNLAGTDVTELLPLASAPKLEKLYLAETAVSWRPIESLQRTKPRIMVVGCNHPGEHPCLTERKVQSEAQATPTIQVPTPSKENEEAMAEMAWPAIIWTGTLTDLLFCLSVNEPDANRREKRIQLALKNGEMTRSQYEENHRHLSHSEPYVVERAKAQRACRISRSDLLEVLTDGACVLKAYKKVGLDRVPRPLSRSYRYRGQFERDLDFPEKRHRQDPGFVAELEARAVQCPDYDIKHLRNWKGAPCLKDDHCLPHLQCHQEAQFPVCTTPDIIAQSKQNAAFLEEQHSKCAKQPACKEFGLCLYNAGECVPSEFNCRQSDVCREKGLCISSGKACVAQSHAGCAASHACKTQSACIRRDKACVQGNAKDCKESYECEESGQCALVNSRCAAAGSADCAASYRCKTYGKCTLKDGVCVVASNTDCASAHVCKKYGQCTANDGECVVGSRKDCRRSRKCTVSGECSFVKEKIHRKNGKIVGKNPAGCVAHSNKDCQQSEECKVNRRCTARNGRCGK